MMLTVAYYAHKNKWGGDVKFSRPRFGKALVELAVVVGWPLAVLGWSSWPGCTPQLVGLRRPGAAVRRSTASSASQAVLPIMTPVLLIGGMTTGLFTPTEGAIAACVWAMVLGLAWYRTLSWKMFVKVCLDTVETTATVHVHRRRGVDLRLDADRHRRHRRHRAVGAGASPRKPWVFLLLANLLMLFVGCFLEPTAAITILVPILLPIATQLGVDPVHFGLVMVLNLMIGLLHPPMGMVLFVLARVASLTFERTTWRSCPGWCRCC